MRFSSLFKKRRSVVSEPEIRDLGDIVWFAADDKDRVPFVLTQIAYDMEYGPQIQLTAKSELGKRMFWQ